MPRQSDQEIRRRHRCTFCYRACQNRLDPRSCWREIQKLEWSTPKAYACVRVPRVRQEKVSSHAHVKRQYIHRRVLSIAEWARFKNGDCWRAKLTTTRIDKVCLRSQQINYIYYFLQLSHIYLDHLILRAADKNFVVGCQAESRDSSGMCSDFDW